MKLSELSVGDYVLAKSFSSSNVLNNFIDNNVGIIVEIMSSVYIKYTNIPYYMLEFGNKGYGELRDHNSSIIFDLSIHQILYYSDDIDELKLKIELNKYNL